jgi:hypothetical protein
VRLWLVPLNSDGSSQGEEVLLTELNIIENQKEGGKSSKRHGNLYDEDILDDAALQLILRPE